ncbi:hypothetical protein A2881_01875 [Candidatus Peribacteria bacterium RIFCSPHIGHO2_01_FULL_55_13]|nr:MAG: hypothetical protein A2881_01875 [Candidatus Peribacteria bacterium RIFCSPHIGHO2_01_FULL_55_13]OGJ64529.1 MAG: hypothetical protein A3F36_00875 [Candidatus Peribacteria bacterium RIFCSPHIGHO2_12_FULL_55_11]
MGVEYFVLGNRDVRSELSIDDFDKQYGNYTFIAVDTESDEIVAAGDSEDEIENAVPPDTIENLQLESARGLRVMLHQWGAVNVSEQP